MLKGILNSIKNVFNSEYFRSLFVMTLIALIFGIALGSAVTEDLKKQQCDEMSVSELLEYPFCRNYLENELEGLNGRY